tara:strand:- start:2 stop:2632 length:2631 start_codon:yes stop_codon:yes gene_type:complete
MATTFVEYTGDGNATKQFTFPSYQESDVKVRVDGVLKTTSTHYNISSYTTTGGGNVVFTSGNIPSSPAKIRIYRDTNVEAAKATYTPGSSVKAADLNNNHTQLLYRAQEEQVPNLIHSWDIADQAIETSDIKDDAVTGDKIADDAVDSEHIAADSLDTEHYAPNSIDATAIGPNAVTTVKILNDNVTMDKLGSGALPTDITVNTDNLVNGTIQTVDIGADQITNALIADNQIDSEHYVDGSIDHVHLSNDCIDSDNIQDNAVNSEHYIDGSIDRVHLEADIIDSTKLADDSVGSEHIQANAVTDSEIATGTLDNRYYTETELDAGQLDNRYFTETELTTGGALDGRYYTETEAEAKFLRQDSSETIASGVAWSNSDAFVATTAAINARIIDLIDEVGGFTAIANETSFPTTNPQGATGQSAILSIQAASTTLTPSGTTITIANGAGSGNTVTITGAPTIPSGFGFLVESTSTTHTYSFHRLVPIATQVNTVAQNITNIVQAGANVVDINNFADIYIISGSEPTQRNDGTSLQEGDLWFDSSNDNLQVYTGSAFSIITPSQSVLDDVAIVSGAITYSEDLGLITDAVSTGSSNGSLDIVADALEDERTFTVTAATGKFIIDGVDKPALTLHKGWTYTFDVSDASNANHPLRFSSGGSAYNTGVTVTGTQGQAGAKVQLVVPESQPTTFIYYCTNHSGMGNSITVAEDPIKAVADIAANVVTVAGIAGNVTTVATNNSNVTSVANNETNINAVQANASNINAAVSNASNINAAVSNATNINTVSGSIGDVNRYANEYKISSSAPGSPSAGDLWFDTSTNTLKNYNGSAWLGITSNSGIQNVADDTTPELAAALDCNNFNLTEVGTISGNNLQLDFGTL